MGVLEQESVRLSAPTPGGRRVIADVPMSECSSEPPFDVCVHRIKGGSGHPTAAHRRLIGDHDQRESCGRQPGRSVHGTGLDLDLFESFDRIRTIDIEDPVPIEQDHPVATLKHCHCPVERCRVDFEEAIREHQSMMTSLGGVWPELDSTARAVIERVADGGTVFWFGNGGSATQALHFATELVGRFERNRPGIRSYALVADTSLMTAVANDYSFDVIFARQIESLCRPGDVAVGLSTSGNSPNVLQAIDAAASLGALTVGFTGGDGGKLAQTVDFSIVAPSSRTCRIQEAHLFLGHTLCELIEASVPESDDVRST